MDPMDWVSVSVVAALATFRARIRPQVLTAGLAFDWQQGQGFAFPALGPRDTLQLFRILQEAVTDAFKHSGRSSLTVMVTAGVAITPDGGAPVSPAAAAYLIDLLRHTLAGRGFLAAS